MDQAEREARQLKLIRDGERRDLAKQLYIVSFMAGNLLCPDAHITDDARVFRCFEAARALLKRSNAGAWLDPE